VRVLVCGGRNFTDWQTVRNTLRNLIAERGLITAIIHGGASGADRMAHVFADFQRVPCETFKADWEAHGKAAGPIRNRRMIDEGKPDLVVAFPGGRGTADMIRRAKAAGIEVIEVRP